MRLVMNMLVRNEADIIERNIRYHHAAGVDAFQVLDHRSTDGTSEILRELARDLELHYTRIEDEAYRQAEWMTALANNEVSKGSDWFTGTDADEFWRPMAPGESIKDSLAVVPGYVDCLSCPWVSVVPHSEAEDISEFVVVKKAPGMPKTFVRPHENTRISVGNHWVYSARHVMDWRWIRPYHYSDRNRAVLGTKYQLGAESLRKAGYAHYVGEHWKEGQDIVTDAGFEELCNRKIKPLGMLVKDPENMLDTTLGEMPWNKKGKNDA